MKISRLRFGIFAFAVTCVGFLNMVRNMWAWPEAPWQTNFAFINDIDQLLSGNFEHVTWYEFGTGHALNGYRWFQFANAYFFGLNGHLETIIYWALMVFAALSISAYLVRTLQKPIISYGISTLISLVILSPTGAGSRGMEIGQFFGAITIVGFLCWSYLITSDRVFRLIGAAFFILLTFTVLGGYIGGWAVAFSLLAVSWKKSLSVSEHRRVTFLAISSAIITVVYALLLRLFGATTVSEGPQTLMAQLIKDPLFAFKYLLIGNDTALATVQTFESIPSWANPLIYYVIAVLMFVPTVLTLLTYRSNVRGSALLPGALAAYGFGTAFTLLFYRPFGAEWLLAPWYGPHFKIGLAGILVMVAILIERNLFRHNMRIVPIALIGLTLTVGGFGWLQQFERQKHERALFLDIARAEVYPEALVERSDGLSQLIIPMEDSKSAIAILKKHGLGVFREGGFDPGNYNLSSGYMLLGEAWGDNWVGKSFTLMPTDRSCRKIQMNFSTYEGRTNRLHYKTLQNDPESVTVAGSGLRISLRPNNASIAFTFDKTWNPKSLGDGQDQRNLAASVRILCED